QRSPRLPPAFPTRRSSDLSRFVLLVGVPALCVVVALAVWQRGGRFVTTENAYVKADIVQIAPEVAGRVLEVAVRDHSRVAAGELDRKSTRLNSSHVKISYA